MNTKQSTEYDVVIMGAGFAGVCQARHLMLNIPNIKVALIDPRPEDRTEKDLKIGESTVEVATLFLGKELGLYDYLIENHPPKLGLNFHWPKNTTQTQMLEDYYHVWCNRQPPLMSVQMNRAKFERDLLKMNKEMGVTFYNGYAVDVDLTPGDALHTVKVKLNGELIELTAKHVIDAAGRKFMIGRKTDNLIFDPENLYGLNTGSVWVRVKNVDRSIFHDGYDPNGATCSHYYGTNHWFGHGHWLWMIPTDTDSHELSVGLIQHRDVISDNQINTKEKFYGFLKTNHNLLYQLVSSGEQVDFHYWRRIAHRSKKMFSEDNWYVMGDAAYIFDAFYSYGTSTIAFAIESVTEIIRAKLAGEANAEEKRSAYNDFNLSYAQIVNHLYKYHPQQLGHASVMSWRIYLEYMWWFGINVPLYLGKWHLNLTFVRRFLKIAPKNIKGLREDIYQQFNQLVERNVNIGFMDCYRADQLIWGYGTPKHFDDFLENTKLEPQRCNLFASMKSTYFYIAVWYLKFQWKGFGWAGLLNPKHIYYFCQILSSVVSAAIAEQVYLFKTKDLPDNSEIEQMRQDFKAYQYHPQLQSWLPDVHTISEGEENDLNPTQKQETAAVLH